MASIELMNKVEALEARVAALEQYIALTQAAERAAYEAAQHQSRETLTLNKRNGKPS